MTHVELEALLCALRFHGVTKYETTEICIELAPAPRPPGETDAAGLEDPDFDPAKAYQDAIQKAAEAIVDANAKRS